MNKIYNCDCIEYMNNINDNNFDITITSPPYNESKKIFGYKKGKYDKISNKLDSRDVEKYKEFIYNIISLLIKKTKYYVFFNIQRLYGNKKVTYDIISHYKKYIKDIFIWIKKYPKPIQINNKIGVSNGYEYIFCFSKYDNKERSMYKRCNIKKHISNYIIKKNTKNIDYKDIDHKAIFPEDLPEFFIKNFSMENDLIFDPFMGSGTTAVVCLKNNRKYVGCEINKNYYNSILRRIKYEKNKMENKFYIGENPDLFSKLL